MGGTVHRFGIPSPQMGDGVCRVPECYSKALCNAR
jgi:hypothetical protein